MTSIAIQQAIPPSRYVRRCGRCRFVRGNSSFSVIAGKRSSVCRFCLEIETSRAKKLRADVKKLAQYRVTERRLSRELERLRLKIRTLEFEAIALEQANLFGGAA